MAKRKPKSKANSSLAKYFGFIFATLFIILIAFLMYSQVDTKEEEVKKEEPKKSFNYKSNKDQKNTINAINSYKKQDLNTSFNDIFKNIDTKKEGCKIATPTCMKEPEKSAFFAKAEESKIHNINSLNQNTETKNLREKNKEQPVFTNNKSDKKQAKLTIIIDDIATKQESDSVLQIIKSGKLLVPSFFPNTSNHPDTNKYTKDFKYFMLHLPLEAMNFDKKEPKTLNVNDSYATIEKRIQDIKKSFPGLKFINNHTGSAFTSDENAMRNLFKALKKYDFIFVDSRTIASTKGKKMSEEFNQAYIYRNVFLDNIQSVDEIKKKLDEAVNLAKKNKKAIAIGHPHPSTFKAIIEYDFSDIKLVGIDEIYKEY